MTSLAFDVRDASQVSAPRREAAALAATLGFDETRAGQAALVVSELATNLVKHARDGQLLLRAIHGRRRPHGVHPYAGVLAAEIAERYVRSRDDQALRSIEILAIDRGPGVGADADAFRDGHSTTGSLGAGLGAIERQSDEFDLYSQPSIGTIAVARLWERPSPTLSRERTTTSPTHASAATPTTTIGAVSVAIRGESICGDAWAAHLDGPMPTIFVADGLGHGVGAAEAASLAAELFDRLPDAAPAQLVDRLHEALRPTRGAAIAVVQLDPAHQVARFAGLGNIGGSVVAPDQTRRQMVSLNGTAGHVARHVQEFVYPLPPHATVVLHSDGMSTQWNPAEYAGLWLRDPALIAGLLYRDFARGRDDTTIVVARCGDPASTIPL